MNGALGCRKKQEMAERRRDMKMRERMRALKTEEKEKVSGCASTNWLSGAECLCVFCVMTAGQGGQEPFLLEEVSYQGHRFGTEVRSVLCSPPMHCVLTLATVTCVLDTTS